MTTPPRPSSHVAVPLRSRDAALAAECDVLVAGGGPAGIGAALGAADAGARVVLAERYGFLGGMATAALVMPLASYFATEPRASEPGDTRLVPTDVANGVPVIAGALERFVARLVAEGGAVAPSADTGYVVPFDVESFKWVAQSMLEEAGVRVLHHALATEALTDARRVLGAAFHTKSGPLAVRAEVTVDCTGDADVAASAGAPFDVGRESDGLVQPMTLFFRIGGFDRPAFEAYVGEHPGQWFGVYGLWELAVEAFRDGIYHAPREDVLLFATTRPDEVAANCTRVPEVLGTDAWDLSHAEEEGRRQMREVMRFLRERVPGFAHAYVNASGTQVGVRESRRIRGLYTLTGDDVLGAHRFGDVVARNAYPVDIHNPQGRGTHLRRLPPCEAYDIPLRCLVPVEHDGLLVAGRCISTTHEALSSVRVMPSCMATGQAAGVAAALAVRAEAAPRDLDARHVQDELLRQGAELRSVSVSDALAGAPRLF